MGLRMVVGTGGGPNLIPAPSGWTMAAWAVGGACIAVSVYCIGSSATSLELTPPWASHDPGHAAIAFGLTSIVTGLISMALPYWVDCRRATRALARTGCRADAREDANE